MSLAMMAKNSVAGGGSSDRLRAGNGADRPIGNVTAAADFKGAPPPTDETAELEDEMPEGVTPIKMGDFITLRGIRIDGFVTAEGILDDSVALARHATDFSDCIFQVRSSAVRSSPRPPPPRATAPHLAPPRRRDTHTHTHDPHRSACSASTRRRTSCGRSSRRS